MDISKLIVSGSTFTKPTQKFVENTLNRTIQGKKIKTIGDVYYDLVEIAANGNKHDAKKYLKQERKIIPDVHTLRANLLYIAGMGNRENMIKINNIFEISKNLKIK